MSFFFFFKQKTAYEMRISDWSSDVCSSDLDALQDFCLKVLHAAETPEDDEKIDSWLGRILRNTLTDHYRRRAARQRAEAAYGLEKIGRASCRERVCQYV